MYVMAQLSSSKTISLIAIASGIRLTMLAVSRGVIGWVTPGLLSDGHGPVGLACRAGRRWHVVKVISKCSHWGSALHDHLSDLEKIVSTEQLVQPAER